MIQVGGIDATRIDLEVPARYGLRQTIGDTTGIGGRVPRAAHVPGADGIARDMRELCPDALFLNYTNPMAMNIWWLSVVAPRLRRSGCATASTGRCTTSASCIGVPMEGTHYRAAGVNHQAWLIEWSRDGENLYPRLRERIAADPELERRVRVEIFRRIGYYPTETSEHSSEYLSWFLRSDEQVERFRLEPLQYIGISEENVAEFEQRRTLLGAGEPLELEEGAAEYAPQIIHSILTGTEREIHANVPNRGLIDNLPRGRGRRGPSTVDAAGVHPIALGAIPAGRRSQPHLPVRRRA